MSLELDSFTREVLQMGEDYARMKDLLRAIESEAAKDGSPFAHNIRQAIRFLLSEIHIREMVQEAKEIQENNFINAAILENETRANTDAED